jgi:pyruvate dehydrogenase E2 component (dihydrolipoamide acetyltransferase)/2-oxoisovalerate dehydrogenase E2 component (dihydrolipoyl transacylase)
MEFQLPELGEGVYEAELITWLVKPGDSVKRGQNLIEVLTDKASMEVPSPFVGTVTSLNAEPGQMIKVGESVLSYEPGGGQAEARSGKPRIEKSKEKPQAKVPEPSPKPVEQASAVEANHEPALAATSAALAVRAAPSVRYMARQLGVDLSRIRGTGPAGRILIGDLSSFIKPGDGKAKLAEEAPPEYGIAGSRIKLHGIRRKIAEHMAQSKKTAPHYTYVDECDMTELVRLREGLKDAAAQTGVKLTYLAFFVKAVASALKDIPIINSSLNDEAGEIDLHDRYHIGIAVSTPGGLIVPVIHDADKKDVMEVGRDIERLTSAARAGKVRLEDLKGGTFTITSIGNIGGLISTPIINYPEVAILGIGKITKRPVYDSSGNLRPADLLYISLSFDHRVVDGAIGAAFCNAVISRIQNPAALLLPAPRK